jgi:putative holliday junction resolvase
LGRILAIDYGRKRTGLAVTDPLKMIANALKTIKTEDIWLFLDEYMAKQEVECIVAGYPKQMNNEPSEAVQYINPFLKKLEKKYPGIKIELMDERFTSKMAQQTMIDGGVKKMKRRDKALLDSISATIILQSYIEKNDNLI